MTGEKPAEELEYLREKGILDNEIFKLEVIENVLKADLATSERLMDVVKRSANKAVESLNQC